MTRLFYVASFDVEHMLPKARTVGSSLSGRCRSLAAKGYAADGTKIARPEDEKAERN